MILESKRGYAFFLIGCTATGKTAVAHYLAKKFNMEILSADSMLVYKGMDIGTAKPDKTMQKEVQYWGIDLVEPNEEFNLAKYVSYVRSIITQIRSPLIVTGGSGLYIKALLCGLDNIDNAIPQKAIREYAEKLLQENGIEALQKELYKKSPELFLSLKDKANPRRLIRALEMAHLPEKKIIKTWEEKKQPKLTGLFMERSSLKKRIVKRAEHFFKNGLIEEAKCLLNFLKDNSNTTLTALQAIGYKEAIALLNGTISLEEAIKETILRTAQLAKKQMTWFKHQANVEWINVQENDSVEKVAEEVLASWQKNGPVKLEL